jgi:hypothetical protein
VDTVHQNFLPAPPRLVEWPVVVGRAPIAADAYVERPALRAALESVTTGTAVLTAAGAGAGATTGGGGIGKTQLAAAAFRAARRAW